ncbi:response regulator transcription factor [Azospirillum thermophilum]|uniref:Response regulator n=1 Tax=Azospirillum thermophilum TaxID=2202148 RepID=A0A2S2CTQ5_9PROT|nr:response regulator [Azospirillum thermophilum]AWK87894.1 response regulator [Azospirillum thermophilum]
MVDAKPVHVLVAEDDALVAWALRDILEEAGYRVTVVPDGARALALEADDPADVLLTDLQMPHLDGGALVRRLRTARPSLPVIVMTANPDDGRLTGLENGTPGTTVIMAKPMRPQPVLAALRAVLDRP